MTPANRRLLVLDPSSNYPETEGAREVAGDWPGEATVLTPVLKPGEMPEPGAGYDVAGIVLMGSAASVHDQDGWIAALADWLRPVVEGTVRVPLLGICFGHQFIAHLAGGEVRFIRQDRSKLVGIRTTTLQDSRLLPDTSTLKVVVSHREEVGTAPAGYQVSATRADCRIDGLEHEALPIFTCQFHPEARDQFAGHAGIDAALINDELRTQSASYLAAFRNLIRGQQPKP